MYIKGIILNAFMKSMRERFLSIVHNYVTQERFLSIVRIL